MCLDRSLFDCDVDERYFVYGIQELTKWVDILSHQDELRRDIDTLRKVYSLIAKARDSIERIDSTRNSSRLDTVFVQFSERISQGVNRMSLASLKSKWARGQVDEIMDFMKKFSCEQKPSERLELAKQILERLQSMIDEMQDLLKQIEGDADLQQLEALLAVLKRKRSDCFSAQPFVVSDFVPTFVKDSRTKQSYESDTETQHDNKNKPSQSQAPNLKHQEQKPKQRVSEPTVKKDEDLVVVISEEKTDSHDVMKSISPEVDTYRSFSPEVDEDAVAKMQRQRQRQQEQEKQKAPEPVVVPRHPLEDTKAIEEEDRKQQQYQDQLKAQEQQERERREYEQSIRDAQKQRLRLKEQADLARQHQEELKKQQQEQQEKKQIRKEEHDSYKSIKVEDLNYELIPEPQSEEEQSDQEDQPIVEPQRKKQIEIEPTQKKDVVDPVVQKKLQEIAQKEEELKRKEEDLNRREELERQKEAQQANNQPVDEPKIPQKQPLVDTRANENKSAKKSQDVVVPPPFGNETIISKESESSESEADSLRTSPREKDIDPTQYSGRKSPNKRASQQETITVQTVTEFLKSEYDGQPSFEKQFQTNDLQDTSEYGYGFWFRYSSTYPRKHIQQDDKYYFLSRLTSNQDLDDYSKYGDRALAVFLFRNVVVFTTYDFAKKEKNVYDSIQNRQQIDGMWYFMQYSYSAKKQLAVGYLKRYGTNEQIDKVEIKCQHVPPFFLKLYIGGQHLHYPGFNGQFANLNYDLDAPAFIDTDEKLLKVIKDMSNQPQSLPSQLKLNVAPDIETLRASETKIRRKESMESNFVTDEYAITVWFRWTDDLVLAQPYVFQIYNLNGNAKRSPQKGAVGDRALELHILAQDSPQRVMFNTYNSDGQGKSFVSKHVMTSHAVWTYAYFGYSHDAHEAYAAFIQPGLAKELVFKVSHRLERKFWLTVGGDSLVSGFNGMICYLNLYLGPHSFRKGLKFEDTFDYGVGASTVFQLGKPIQLNDGESGEIKAVYHDQEDTVVDFIVVHDDHENKINGQGEYSFSLWTRWLRSSPKTLDQRRSQHRIGRLGTQRKELIVEEDSETSEEPSSDYSTEEEEFETYDEYDYDENIIEDFRSKKKKVTKTVNKPKKEKPPKEPKPPKTPQPPKRAQSNNSVVTPKDTTLGVTLGQGFYIFTTYTTSPQEVGGITKNIMYGDDLEGYWNYVSFSYKRTQSGGIAKGYVMFSKRVGEVSFDVTHDLIIDYLEFYIGKEHNLPLFNGYMSQIEVQIGPKAFVTTVDDLNSRSIGSLPQPNLLKPLKRKTLLLTAQQVHFGDGTSSSDEEGSFSSSEDDRIKQEQLKLKPVESDLQYSFMQGMEGAKEYSVSGWIKWDGEKIGGVQHNIVIMAQTHFKELDSTKLETLSVLRNDVGYKFITYSCAKEIECRSDISSEQSYTEYWDQWTFLYFGYSEKLQKVFGYLRFPFSESKFELVQVKHFYLSPFTIALGKQFQQRHLFEGYMKTWVVNIGDGSYREGQFEDSEDVKVHFGLQAGTDHIKLQNAEQELHHNDEVIDCSVTNSTIPLNVEFYHGQDVHLQGVSEYGYGYWSRFVYLTPVGRLYVKPNLMGMSRLTINRNNSDLSEPGDRTLAVWLGRGYYQFATYNIQPEQNNVFGNIEYLPEMEGSWVYVYFSYKRKGASQGHALAFTVMGEFVNGIQMNVLHRPLQDYLRLTVGHSGKTYPNFNGKITHIRFNLGPGAFVESKAAVVSRTQNKDPQPQYLRSTNKVEQIQEKKKDILIDEANPMKLMYADAQEYSVSLWFRWQRDNTEPQILLRLSTTEPSQKADHQKPGDRTFVLIHDAQGFLFSTYMVIEKDVIKSPLNYQCAIAQPHLEEWTFAYMGYTREHQKLQYYLKNDNLECQGNEQVLHITPQEFYLYLGSDGFYKRFSGKVGLVQAQFGDDSYRDKDLHLLMNYIRGQKEFTMAIKYTYESQDVVEHSSETSTKQEFHDSAASPIEGVGEYSYGFWSRYMTTFPERLNKRPEIQQVARLTYRNQSNAKVEQGDRILSTYLVFNNYLFQTYDTQTNNNALTTKIEYGDQLESTWRYIYVGYSKVKQQVVAVTIELVNGDRLVRRQILNEVLHKPLGEYAAFLTGREKEIAGFNGLITQIAVKFGKNAFNFDSSEIETLISSTYALPSDLTEEVQQSKPRENQEIMGESEKIGTSGGKVLSGNTWFGAGQYSISGWIKYMAIDQEPQLIKDESTESETSEEEDQTQQGSEEEDTFSFNSECQIIFRITDNDPSLQGDREHQGDRALYAEICGGQMIRFSTYTLLSLSEVNEAKHSDKSVQLGQFKNSWIYLYMGYDEPSQTVTAVMHTSAGDNPLVFERIQHFVPNYISIFVGKDRFKSRFQGYMQHWVASSGTGSFVNVKQKGYQANLHNYNAVQSDDSYEWFVEDANQTFINQTFVKEFTSEADSITEYGFSIWTRWLTDIPTKLVDRARIHTIFRLSTTAEYSDQTEMGNRALSAFVISQKYLFSTYDLEKNNPAASETIPYDNDLEGQWNFIYMGYQMRAQMAVGIILFSGRQVTLNTQISALHNMMASYARLTISAKEFGYQPFHGYLFDPRLYFGKNAFIMNGKDLVEKLLIKHREPPLSPSTAPDFSWDKSIDTANDQDYKSKQDDLMFRFNYTDVREYAFGAWIQPEMNSGEKIAQDQLVMRLTTNDLELQSDDQNTGDRTFLIINSPNQYDFSTYTIKEPRHESLTKSIQVQENKFQWVYVYFGYNPKLRNAYAYTLFTTREHGETFKQVFHVIPQQFYLYIVKDSTFAKFHGKVQSVVMKFGVGAYTTKPKEIIDKWPYKQLQINTAQSVQLISRGIPQNQMKGMNSAQIIRNSTRKS